MSDMLEDANEINDIMGREYGVPEALDEDDLMDELQSMEGEVEAESDEVPSYLVNAATAAKTSGGVKRDEAKSSSAYPEVEVDDLGLPQVPVRSVQM